jgi:hypothetical protein
MTLRQIRKMFVEKSGRYDLMNDDGADNGADFFIQRGQRHLENLVSNGRQDAEHYVTLTGVSHFCLPNIRIVKELYAKGVQQKRTKLVRISLAQAREYVVGEISNNEMPQYYCVFNTRGAYDEVVAEPGECFLNATDDVTNNMTYAQVGFLLLPRISAGTVLDVVVHTTTREPLLATDEDENSWTTEWPELLLYSAFRVMEVTYRNTQGVKDWDQAIASILVPLDMDWVEDDMQNAVRMEG